MTANEYGSELVYRLVTNVAGGQFWPLFSPDGRYIVMETRDYIDGVEDNKVVFFDLSYYLNI